MRTVKNKDQFHKYRQLMLTLTLSAEIYLLFKAAFQGGFTHANPYYVGKILNDVKSYDFASSYPYVMISEKFPMSKPKYIELKSQKEFKNYLKNYACVFEVEFEELESLVFFDNYISSSHCSVLTNPVIANGRVVSASQLTTIMTEQDFDIISKTYRWKNIKVSKFHYMYKAYLPTPLVKSIIKLFQDKTQLKGVEGKEVEYLLSKGNLNSVYGMTVTDICREEIVYKDDWEEGEKIDIEKVINKHNKSVNRFLYYPWGVWVTAYARHNLWSGILEFADDYIYSDTDSVKVINYDKHKDYIEKYNKETQEKLKAACAYHKIKYKELTPKNIKGKVCYLGKWDDEGVYTRFKTLGAKRYMVEKDGKINITVAGLNKHYCVPYLVWKYKNKVFENFNDHLFIPSVSQLTPELKAIFEEYEGRQLTDSEYCPTGKNTHTYIDEEQTEWITDYLGNKYKIHELSSVHLAPAEYDLSLAQQFINYIMGLDEDRDSG